MCGYVRPKTYDGLAALNDFTFITVELNCQPAFRNVDQANNTIYLCKFRICASG